MKSILIPILAALLLMTACGSPNPSSSSEVPSQSSSVSSETSSSNPEDTASPISQNIVVADAAMYRGVISEMKTTDGKTTMILSQAQGRDFGAPLLQIVFDENTKFSGDKAALKDGDYIEVYYGRPGAIDTTKPYGVLAVNTLPPVEMCIYNGTVVSIDTENSSILMKAMDGDMEYVFNFNDTTQFYMNKDDIKAGDTLHIYHNPASTRSMPPQSFAYEISVFKDVALAGNDIAPKTPAIEPAPASSTAPETPVTLPAILPEK